MDPGPAAPPRPSDPSRPGRPVRPAPGVALPPRPAPPRTRRGVPARRTRPPAAGAAPPAARRAARPAAAAGAARRGGGRTAARPAAGGGGGGRGVGGLGGLGAARGLGGRTGRASSASKRAATSAALDGRSSGRVASISATSSASSSGAASSPSGGGACRSTRSTRSLGCSADPGRERRPPGQRRVQRRAEAVQVGPGGHGPVPERLRRGVLAGVGRVARVEPAQRQPEVGQHRLAGRADQQVGRDHPPVQHAGLVRLGQRGGGRGADRGDLLGVEPVAPVEQRGDRVGAQLGDQVRPAVVEHVHVVDLEHRGDVLQPAQPGPVEVELVAGLPVERRGQHLDRDRQPGLLQGAAVDDGEAHLGQQGQPGDAGHLGRPGGHRMQGIEVVLTSCATHPDTSRPWRTKPV